MKVQRGVAFVLSDEEAEILVAVLDSFLDNDHESTIKVYAKERKLSKWLLEQLQIIREKKK